MLRTGGRSPRTGDRRRRFEGKPRLTMGCREDDDDDDDIQKGRRQILIIIIKRRY
jgi:hypothetical protein